MKMWHSHWIILAMLSSHEAAKSGHGEPRLVKSWCQHTATVPTTARAWTSQKILLQRMQPRYGRMLHFYQTRKDLWCNHDAEILNKNHEPAMEDRLHRSGKDKMKPLAFLKYNLAPNVCTRILKILSSRSAWSPIPRTSSMPRSNTTASRRQQECVGHNMHVTSPEIRSIWEREPSLNHPKYEYIKDTKDEATSSLSKANRYIISP